MSHALSEVELTDEREAHYSLCLSPPTCGKRTRPMPGAACHIEQVMTCQQNGLAARAFGPGRDGQGS